MADKAEDRFAYSEGELSLVDPETGDTTRIGKVPAEYSDRPITEDDVAAAARGHQMSRMSRAALMALANDHASNPLFASRVIAEAARRAARRAIR